MGFILFRPKIFNNKESIFNGIGMTGITYPFESNNFEFVESVITKLLDLNGYVIPVIPIPLKILSLLLKILGRNNINPMANYSSQKLLDLGFKRTIVFEDTVSQYIKNERS